MIEREKMGAKLNNQEKKITPVRLHLELRDDFLDDYQKRILKRYAESSTGTSISRDILVPSDMPLHNLHYAIQKLFGWQNSHLRQFQLPTETYSRLTGDTVRGWSKLVGVLFQPPTEGTDDIFWDDDYISGSFNTWLKKKYIGPYEYEGTMEIEEIAKQDMQEFLDHYKMVEVEEPFATYYERKEKEGDTESKVIKKAPLIDLTIEEMNFSVMFDGGSNVLLERLIIDKLIASKDEKIQKEKLFPTTREIKYNYDFGDNWEVIITKFTDCDDLLENNRIDLNELEEAKNTVIEEHKPVCIHKDGIFVLDDVGGMNGFVDMLVTLYEGEDKQEAADMRRWAKSLGWNDKKISCKSIL